MQQYWDIFRKKVKYLWLWIWRKDVVIFLLFVGLTMIFWWGRVLSSPRDMHMKVSVNYTGIPQQIVLDRELPKTLTITVRDEGKQLRQISRHGVELSMNLSRYLREDHGKVELTADVLRPRLQDILPGSMQLQHVLPENIEFAYHTQEKKRVGVQVLSKITIADQHHLVSEGKVTPDSVDVFGDKETIQAIRYILTDSVRVDQLRDSMSQQVALQVPQGIRVEPDSVRVEWVAEQFTEKSFTLPIQIEGVPAGENLRLFPQTAHVTVRVSMSHFANVVSEDLHVVCHYPTKECPSLPLKVHTQNPYIYNVRILPTAVEYIIER